MGYLPLVDWVRGLLTNGVNLDDEGNIMSSKRILWLSCLAAAISFGCSDDSNSAKGSDSFIPATCDPSCENCEDGVCKDGENIPKPPEEDPDKDKDKDKDKKCDPECVDGQICQAGECVDDPDAPHEDPNVCSTICDLGSSCQDGACVPDVCETECEPGFTCVQGECAENSRLCGDTLCEVGQACDELLFSCEDACPSGALPCGQMCCEEGRHCDTNYFMCILTCEEGQEQCGASLCCGEGQKCDGDVCTVVCAEGDTYCGSGATAVCCTGDDVCVDGACMAACAGTRCGEGKKLCCTGEEACIFDKCLKGTKCESDNACDLDEYCDTENHMCIKVSENPKSCIYKPPTAAFQPKEKWHYTVPDANGVVQTPVVINLTDDNDDGKIDKEDTPDVVFIDNRYTVTALSGDTGAVLARTDASDISTGRTLYNRHNELGAADIDNDGKVEVVAPVIHAELAKSTLNILNLEKKDGKYTWVVKKEIPAPAGASFGYGNGGAGNTYWSDYHPTFADVDADGTPEIITTQGIIKGSDLSKWACTFAMPRVSTWYMSFFAVADLDRDGQMEIINTDIWDNQCNVILNHSDAKQSMNMDGSPNATGYWYTAVADLVKDDGKYPGELVPEIVRVRSGFVSVWKVYKNVVDGKPVWSQRLVWEAKQTSNVGGGNPVIADFDGDGDPDIGVAGELAYSVFNGQDGTLVWASKTQDKSSNKTGSSVFDFEGDGVAEVVYRDETTLRIYSGKPGEGTVTLDNGGTYPAGKILWETPNTSGTVIENPVIVDVDNDGRTEIVMVDENVPSKGITVYMDTNDNWVRTRRVWNQHAYHVTNITEDGKVPKNEEANWLNTRYNNYRQNVQPDGLFNAPNFQAGKLKADEKCDEHHMMNLYAEVKNEGSVTSGKGMNVAFYVVDYGEKKEKLWIADVTLTKSVAPGGTQEITFLWDKKAENSEGKRIDLTFPVKVVFEVDAPLHGASEKKGAFNECIEDDNTSEPFDINACTEDVN